jgi:hypothetical protein
MGGGGGGGGEREREREREREERMFNLKCKMLSHIYLRILILP